LAQRVELGAELVEVRREIRALEDLRLLGLRALED
jgi:hypothetical protein